MKSMQARQRGYTLVELLVALTIGIVLIGAVIMVYVTQTQVYKATNSQAATQNAENAIAALVTPAIRAAGFMGCSNIWQPYVSNLNAGGPPPLGTLATPSLLAGYDANGTAGTGTLTITQDNTANDSNVAHWTPSLDASLASQVETGSDVLVVLSALPGSQPVAVTSPITAGVSTTFTVQSATGLAAGQLAAVSDCGKTSIFKITGVAGTTLTHAAGGGALANVTATIPVNFNSPWLIPIQQTAIYVAQGQGGQSVLMRATYDGGAWTASPLVPGVQTMQVLYGVDTNADGIVDQYVPASAVTAATPVYSVRLGFLIEGQPGSAGASNPTQFTILGTTVNTPQDTLQRRVYEMTVDLRNAS